MKNLRLPDKDELLACVISTPHKQLRHSESLLGIKEWQQDSKICILHVSFAAMSQGELSALLGF